MRVLLVEDDKSLADIVVAGMREQRLTAVVATSAHEGRERAALGDYNVIVLDVMLPDGSGFELCAWIRARGITTPILMLTARDAIDDRVLGLEAGADDYLIKPFDLEELTARIHALLRRQAGRAEEVIRHGELVLNPATHEAVLGGSALALSAREFALLRALLERPGVVLSVAQLQEKLYGWDDEVGSNTIEVYIHSLRKKLGPGFIKNVRGVGYMIPRLP